MLKDAAAEDAALQAGCEVPQALRPWLGFAAGCVTQFNVSSFPLPAKASEGCFEGHLGARLVPGGRRALGCSCGRDHGASQRRSFT